jgi:hypothetical protein
MPISEIPSAARDPYLQENFLRLADRWAKSTLFVDD